MNNCKCSRSKNLNEPRMVLAGRVIEFFLTFALPKSSDET
jgi:hypothetical protein